MNKVEQNEVITLDFPKEWIKKAKILNGHKEGKYWNDEKINFLKYAVKNGIGTTAISKVIGVNVKTVDNKVTSLKVRNLI